MPTIVYLHGPPWIPGNKEHLEKWEHVRNPYGTARNYVGVDAKGNLRLENELVQLRTINLSSWDSKVILEL